MDGFECFCCNILWIRKEKGLSKKEMAAIMHTGEKSIEKLEKGILPRKLSVDALFFLSEYFDIPSDKWFRCFFGEK